MNITITTAAYAYIKQMLAQEQKLAYFRLSIKKTGCSGYSYAPELVHEIIASDECVEISNDLKVFLDTTWLSYLQGTTIDYVEEIKNGLKQKRLLFKSPSETSRCGCGESFHANVEK